MSWDVFVQDLPADAHSVHDIPDDFSPGPIGRRSDIVRGIAEVVPSVDFTDPTMGVITADDYTIEIGLGASDPVRSFAFHVGGGVAAADLVADILDHLGLRALDPGAAGGIFSRAEARASMTGWQEYRDEALEA